MLKQRVVVRKRGRSYLIIETPEDTSVRPSVLATAETREMLNNRLRRMSYAASDDGIQLVVIDRTR